MSQLDLTEFQRQHGRINIWARIYPMLRDKQPKAQ
jgi:hypothetical protein